MQHNYQIGFLIFPQMTQLDVMGPAEVLGRIPDVKLHMIWKDLSPVPVDAGGQSIQRHPRLGGDDGGSQRSAKLTVSSCVIQPFLLRHPELDSGTTVAHTNRSALVSHRS